MKIKPDIEENVKKMIWQNEFLSRFLRIKILPRSNVKHSPKNMPTETYHTQKWRKFYNDFDGRFRFITATYFIRENTILLRQIYMHIPYYFDKYKKGLI